MREGPVTPQGCFKHYWQAAILKQRPLILPRRRYVYPREAEEVERGALELLIQPAAASRAPDVSLVKPNQMRVPHVSPLRHGTSEASTKSDTATDAFLATCALGFADPTAPTGVWACPDPDRLCAVAGGYAYLIDTLHPELFEQVAYRPVLAVYTVEADQAGSLPLLLFVGSHAIVAYGSEGLQWQSPLLSSEGVEVSSIANGRLQGRGWELQSDTEPAFTLDLRTGLLV